MYKITLKTKEVAPIILDDNTGIKVKEVWLDSNKPKDFKIALDSVIFEKGKIDTIEYKKERPVAKNTQKEALHDPFKEALGIRKLSPEDKAKRIEAYINVYNAIHKKKPSKEIISLLTQALIKFFRENPKRTRADFSVYEPYLYSKKKGHKLTLATLRFVEIFSMYLAEDLDFARRV